MSNKNKNFFYKINFEAFFPEFTQAVKDAVEKYWEIDDAYLSFQAVNNFKEIREESLIANTDFFSSQIRVERHKPIVIRLSKELIEKFLDTTLDIKNYSFKLNELTQLEVKILNNFTEFIYKKFKDFLISPKNLKLGELSEKYINFLFITSIKKNTKGHILISIPQDRLPLENLTLKNNFKDEDFISSRADVKIKAGSAKITLQDLEHLAIGDIVLLDKSNLQYLTLISGGVEKKFKVKVDPSLIISMDEDDYSDDEAYETNNNEVNMEKNLWDDIQIELNAEFDRVKMTIGELKQITQGQVVDLGSVFDSEVSLYVEEKKVAKGDLIIINDRYAVKLSEVLSSKIGKSSIPQSVTLAIESDDSEKVQKVEPPKKQKIAPPPPEDDEEFDDDDDDDDEDDDDDDDDDEDDDEEFDYSDFEQ